MSLLLCSCFSFTVITGRNPRGRNSWIIVVISFILWRWYPAAIRRGRVCNMLDIPPCLSCSLIDEVFKNDGSFSDDKGNRRKKKSKWYQIKMLCRKRKRARKHAKPPNEANSERKRSEKNEEEQWGERADAATQPRGGRRRDDPGQTRRRVSVHSPSRHSLPFPIHLLLRLLYTVDGSPAGLSSYPAPSLNAISLQISSQEKIKIFFFPCLPVWLSASPLFLRKWTSYFVLSCDSPTYMQHRKILYLSFSLLQKRVCKQVLGT